MTANELKEFLRNTLETAFASVDDKYYENTLEIVHCDLEIKGYSVDMKIVNHGDWTAGQKYQELEDAVSCITLEGHKFYVGIGQMRSGSPFSDYFYNDAYVSYIQTEKEYNAPTEVVSFMYKGQKITILSDDSAKMENGMIASSVELAIDLINHPNK